MLRFDGRIYESSKEMGEIMNKCFQKVFTRESDYVQMDKEAEMEKIEKWW